MKGLQIMKNRIFFRLTFFYLLVFSMIKSAYCQTKISDDQIIPSELMIEFSEFLQPGFVIGKIASLNKLNFKLIKKSEYLRKISPYGVKDRTTQKWYFYQELMQKNSQISDLHINDFQAIVSELPPENLIFLSRGFESKHQDFIQLMSQHLLTEKISRLLPAKSTIKPNQSWRLKSYRLLYTMFAFYDAYWTSVLHSASEALWCETNYGRRTFAESQAWFSAHESELYKVMTNLNYARMEADIDLKDSQWSKLVEKTKNLPGAVSDKVERILRNEIQTSSLWPDSDINHKNSERISLLFYLAGQNYGLIRQFFNQSETLIDIKSLNIFYDKSSWADFRKKYFDQDCHPLIRPWILSIDRIVDQNH